jgi:hypothetical protein
MFVDCLKIVCKQNQCILFPIRNGKQDTMFADADEYLNPSSVYHELPPRQGNVDTQDYAETWYATINNL